MSILLIGTGYMGKEYAKVLKAMKLPFLAIGRSQNSSDVFTAEIGTKAESGGLNNWLKKNKVPDKAIAAVTENQLGVTTRQLIKAGCKEILVEKPGGVDVKDIKSVASEAKKHKAKVFIGYNRRFHASALAALDIIKKESVSSFNFDFTERSYVVETSKQSDKIKKGWFLQNNLVQNRKIKMASGGSNLYRCRNNRDRGIVLVSCQLGIGRQMERRNSYQKIKTYFQTIRKTANSKIRQHGH